VGITYRQLDYWARTNLLRPSIADAKGSGSQRRYSYTDLVELKVIKGLLDAGVSLASARSALAYLRDHLEEDLASAHLVLSGDHPLLMRDDGAIIDLLRSGQGVLNIVPLRSVMAQLNSAIELHGTPLDSQVVAAHGDSRPAGTSVADPAIAAG
jgi:DNA-binding transcriptional MerR regulator